MREDRENVRDSKTQISRRRQARRTNNYEYITNVNHIAVQHQKQQREHHDITFDQFNDATVRCANHSKILTKDLCIDVVQFVQHRLFSDLSRRERRTNLFLCQHKIRCEQMINEFLIERRLHVENTNNRRSHNQHSQRLQFVICFLHIQNCLNFFKNNEKQIRKQRKSHFVKRFQSSSFNVKRNIQIDSTRCSESIHKRRFANANAIHIVDEHYHLKNTTFKQHNKSYVHDQLICEQRN